MILAYVIWVGIALAILGAGWPFWPLLTTTAALLTWFAWRSGDDWLVPLSAVVGYLLMRAVMLSNPELQMYLAGALWLSIGAFMASRGWVWSGMAYATSGVVYPILALFGMRVVYLGTVAIIADLLAICALWWIDGGLRGHSHPWSPDDRRGGVVVQQDHSQAMAENKSSDG